MSVCFVTTDANLVSGILTLGAVSLDSLIEYSATAVVAVVATCTDLNYPITQSTEPIIRAKSIVVLYKDITVVN